MSDPISLESGARVQDKLGHWYEVLRRGNDYIYQVQALTPKGTDLVPIGAAFWMSVSEMRTTDV